MKGVAQKSKSQTQPGKGQGEKGKGFILLSRGNALIAMEDSNPIVLWPGRHR